MEARLHSDHEIGAGAAVAVDAGIEAPRIRIVVVAREAIDGHVLAVIEIQRQLPLTADERLAQRNARAPGDHRREGEHCRPEDDGHEARMTAEREPAQRELAARGLGAAHGVAGAAPCLPPPPPGTARAGRTRRCTGPPPARARPPGPSRRSRARCASPGNCGDSSRGAAVRNPMRSRRAARDRGARRFRPAGTAVPSASSRRRPPCRSERPLGRAGRPPPGQSIRAAHGGRATAARAASIRAAGPARRGRGRRASRRVPGAPTAPTQPA